MAELAEQGRHAPRCSNRGKVSIEEFVKDPSKSPLLDSTCDACPPVEPSNDLGVSCASNMVAPRSEVQAELCGPSGLPTRQLQTLVRGLLPLDLTRKITRSQSW